MRLCLRGVCLGHRLEMYIGLMFKFPSMHVPPDYNNMGSIRGEGTVSLGVSKRLGRKSCIVFGINGTSYLQPSCRFN